VYGELLLRINFWDMWTRPARAQVIPENGEVKRGGSWGTPPRFRQATMAWVWMCLMSSWPEKIGLFVLEDGAAEARWEL
jgi:hypothetical protein